MVLPALNAPLSLGTFPALDRYLSTLTPSPSVLILVDGSLHGGRCLPRGGDIRAKTGCLRQSGVSHVTLLTVISACLSHFPCTDSLLGVLTRTG